MELNVKEVVEKLKIFFNVKTQKQLVECMGWQEANLSGWLKRNSTGAILENIMAHKNADEILKMLFCARVNAEQKKYNFAPLSIEINTIPTITSALKTKLNEVVDLLSDDIYEQNLSLRELQIENNDTPDSYIPCVDILDETLALYKQLKNGAGNPEFKSQKIAEKINMLKLDYQRSIKHEYKISTLLRHWTSILDQESKVGFE